MLTTYSSAALNKPVPTQSSYLQSKHRKSKQGLFNNSWAPRRNYETLYVETVINRGPLNAHPHPHPPPLQKNCRAINFSLPSLQGYYDWTSKISMSDFVPWYIVGQEYRYEFETRRIQDFDQGKHFFFFFSKGKRLQGKGIFKQKSDS